MFFSNTTINHEEIGLNGRVKFNFPFTVFPEDIKIFVPRVYENKTDYMKILIPFEKMSKYSRFSTAYIRERKEEKYNELKKIIGEKRFSFSILEQWVFYDFLDFLFDHTGLMRNDDNQIEKFQDCNECSFWNVLIHFRDDYWFLDFFLKNLPILKSFLESIPNKSYLSEMISKIENIKLEMFEKKNQMWLVLLNQNYIFLLYIVPISN